MVLTVLSFALALLLAPIVLYLFVLTLCSGLPRPRPNPTRGAFRFAIVVPAHDEEQMIGDTVASLLAVDYPRDDFTVVVVADNCSDRTAEVARRAGARTLERTDPERRGKGYALDFAFTTLLAEGQANALVVVDADTAVSPALLAAFAARLATGERVVQGRYGVRNIDASWRTRLMAIALGMFHDLRSLARERLRLSCGLRGNGMCFAVDVLAAHPHRAHGLVEDVEYGVELGLAGIRVAYAHEAEVRGEMAAGRRAATTQRERWEGGRATLARQWVGPLLRRAVGRRDRVALDLALDLATPPLSRIALVTALGFGLEGYAWLAHGAVTAAAWIWTALALGLAAYVLRGVALSGLGARGLVVLALAPCYVLWKVVAVGRRAPAQWKRTERP